MSQRGGLGLWVPLLDWFKLPCLIQKCSSIRFYNGSGVFQHPTLNSGLQLWSTIMLIISCCVQMACRACLHVYTQDYCVHHFAIGKPQQSLLSAPVGALGSLVTQPGFRQAYTPGCFARFSCVAWQLKELSIAALSDRQIIIAVVSSCTSSSVYSSTRSWLFLSQCLTPFCAK